MTMSLNGSCPEGAARKPCRIPVALVAALAGSAAVGVQQPTARATRSSNAQTHWSLVTIEAVTETLPPITLRGRRFTVAVHKRRLVWPAEATHTFSADDDETARAFEIRNAAGARVYFQPLTQPLPSIDTDLSEVRSHGRFVFSTGISARRLDGEADQAVHADYIGKILETSKQDSVNVELKELVGIDQVVIEYGKYV